MGVAALTALRSTCARRQVGCVLLDAKGRVLATGYNGSAQGQPHCVEVVGYCPGRDSPSGTNLDGCLAIHAEQNALLQCGDVDAVEVCYTTTAPCVTCAKLLLNTACRRVVFLEPYAPSVAEALWRSAGREWFALGEFIKVHFSEVGSSNA